MWAKYGSATAATLSSEALINNLRQIPQGVDGSKAKAHLEQSLRDRGCFTVPIPIPVCPNLKAVGINLDTLKVKNSATRPILFACQVVHLRVGLTQQLESGGEKNILFKSEDIRKDQIVTNLISLMDRFLKEAGLDLEIVTYRCIPTSPEDGLIEIVPNSETLYHIENVCCSRCSYLRIQRGDTLTNWIFDNNSSDTVDTVRQKFVKSCAAYCVITYLLGVGNSSD